MVYLILCIVFSSAIFALFKIFEKFNINLLQAIIINYFTAFSIGIFTFNGIVNFSTLHHKPWFIGALILAILFISVFNVMGITSQKNGVSVAAVSGKMAVVIPIIAGVFLYQEKLSTVKIFGIILALIAVYFTTKKQTINPTKNNSLIYPILLFIGAGIIDTTLKYIQTYFVPTNETSLFSGVIFGLSGIIGIIIYCIKPSKIHLKNIVAGITLGIINYFSVYYLLKELEALEAMGMFSAEIFSINNVAIVTLSSLIAVLLFKEKLNYLNKAGIAIALISIFLMSI